MGAIASSTVRVTLATPSERPLIEGLTQFYIYDFSEMAPVDPNGFAFNERGCYDPLTDMADYWGREGYHPLIIRVEGRAAGFALINTVSHSGGTVERNMGEFFVARLYRRAGVASEAVRQILALYPGRWEAAVMARNLAAQAFWPRAISSAAGVSGLRRLEGHGEHWRGPIWAFTVSAGAQ
jgi:predicted acetyltransferase